MTPETDSMEKGADPAVIGWFVERGTKQSQGEYTFASKQLRDSVAKQLRKAGFHVRRSSMRNQRLHPQYIDDVDDGETGFGNTDYLRWWTAIYLVSWHQPNTASPAYCRACRTPGAW